MPTEAWFAAVPLQVPLPPAPWTSLLEGFGFDALFGPEAFPDGLVDDLLGSAGRPVAADETRLLRFTTPIHAGPGPTERLLACLTRPSVLQAVEVLGRRGDRDAIEPLRSLLGQVRPWMRGTLWVALARLGVPGEGLLDWDEETAADQLLARALLGELVEEVPEALPELLHQWLETREGAVLGTLLGSVDRTVLEAVGWMARAVPPEILLEQLPAVVGAAVRSPVWSERIAELGEDVLEELTALLRSEDWERRAQAASVLGGLEEAPEPVRRALTVAMDDDDADVRREATLALHRHEPTVPLVEWSDLDDFPSRAARGVPGLAGPPVTGPALATLLHPHVPELGARVLLGLALEGPEHAPLFEAVALDAMRDQPLALRRAAAAASLVAGVPPGRLPELYRVLLRDDGGVEPGVDGLRQEALLALAARDADWEVRVTALRLAARTGSLAAQRPLLGILATSDTDPHVRAQAAALLAPEYRVERLATLLCDAFVQLPGDPHGRARALTRLAEVDPGRARELAAAFSTLDDRELAVVGSRVLGRLADDDTAARLARQALAGLRAGSWVRREAAAALLGSLPGPALGHELADELAEVLETLASDDEDDDVRRVAAWAALQLRRW